MLTSDSWNGEDDLWIRILGDKEPKQDHRAVGTGGVAERAGGSGTASYVYVCMCVCTSLFVSSCIHKICSKRCCKNQLPVAP